MPPTCAAVTTDGHRCTRQAPSDQRQSRPVCRSHAKQYDGWKVDPTRDERKMAAFWWGWKDVVI